MSKLFICNMGRGEGILCVSWIQVLINENGCVGEYIFFSFGRGITFSDFVGIWATLPIKLTITRSSSYGYALQQINNGKQFTTFAGHFDGDDDKPVQWGAHCPMEQVHGYTRCHWTLPLGKYLPHIALADAMVIDVGSRNQVVALWNRCFEASVWNAQNGHSTQLIKATSWVEQLNAAIKANKLSKFSSYQMLTADKYWQSYYSPTKLIKKWTVMTFHRS